jgi:hypothetical protein
MGTLKSAFGVIGALVGLLYCVGLFYYFFGFAESLEDAERNGLGVALLSMGVFGLLFLVVLILRITRLFGGPRSPGSYRRDGAGGSTDDEGGFDADATIARYLASRATDSPAAPVAHQSAEPARSPGFGRRTR